MTTSLTQGVSSAEKLLEAYPEMMKLRTHRTKQILKVGALITTGILVVIPAAFGAYPGDEQNKIPSSISDFTLKGTLPNSDANEFAPLYSAANCMFCHGDYGTSQFQGHLRL